MGVATLLACAPAAPVCEGKRRRAPPTPDLVRTSTGVTWEEAAAVPQTLVTRARVPTRAMVNAYQQNRQLYQVDLPRPFVEKHCILIAFFSSIKPLFAWFDCQDEEDRAECISLDRVTADVVNRVCVTYGGGDKYGGRSVQVCYRVDYMCNASCERFGRKCGCAWKRGACWVDPQ